MDGCCSLLHSDVSRYRGLSRERWVALLVVATGLLGGGMRAGLGQVQTTTQSTQTVTQLSLHDAIERAQSSPLARMNQAQVDVVQGQVRQARLRINPRLYLQSEDIRPWANNFDFANATEDYAYLGQTLETAGKRGRRIELAQANLHRAEAERMLGLQQLAGRIAASYWTAVATARIRTLLEADLGDVDAMVRYHQERVNAGAMRGVDLLRMQIERDRIFIALEAARRDAVVARVELARAIGQPVGAEMQLTDSIDALDPVAEQKDEVVLAQRPEMQIAEDALTAARADLKLQRAQAFPDVDVLGGFKRNTVDNTLYAGLQMPLPLWNRNQGEIQRAQAQVQMAQASVEQTQLMVQADVNAATEVYTRQLAIVQHTLPDMREHAKKNLEILSDAYKTGGTDLLRYIDAERTEIDVEVNALRSLAEFHQSALRLQLAYGVQP